jgi:hypothetical protein
MSTLVETISKKPIPEHQKNVIFEITAEDETEEDVEIGSRTRRQKTTVTKRLKMCYNDGALAFGACSYEQGKLRWNGFRPRQHSTWPEWNTYIACIAKGKKHKNE